MTPRDVIAADLLPICDWMEDAVCATHTAETVAEAKKLRGMLSAAGFVIVPREPTEKMLDIGWFALPESEPDAIWRAMLSASQEPADGK